MKPDSSDLSYLGSSDPRWLNFLESTGQGNIFHHPAWSTLLSEAYGYHPFVMAIIDSAGLVQSGLPMMEVGRFSGKNHWISLPFSDHCHPLYLNSESLIRLIKILNVLAMDENTPAIQVRWVKIYPSHYSVKNEYVLSNLSLNSDIDVLKRRMKAKHRRMEQVSRQRGVEVVTDNSLTNLKIFYSLHLKTRRRLGVPAQPWRFFVLLKQYLLDNNLGFLSLAIKNNQCLAADIFLHWNKTITYKYSAASESEKNLCPNDAILWDAIRWGCANGFSCLDLGRSELSNSGLRFFKKRWGSEEIPLSYARSKDDADLINERMIRISKQLIQKSPIWVCQTIGNLFYKYVG